MKLRFKIGIISVLLMVLSSCTEDIIIDLEEGEPMVGVEASFTNEMKRHEAIVSYTADFYNKDAIRMVSEATVFVTDGVDTVYYFEDLEKKGHYYTDSVAGKKNTLYRLCVDVPEADGDILHLFSESRIPDNVDVIDSIVIKPFNGVDDTMPSTFLNDTIEWVYPYFQSLSNPEIIYSPSIYKNDTLLTDTLSQQSLIPVGGYAGYYINGPEMQAANKEIPVYAFMKRNLRNGDRVRLEMCSIPLEYLTYYYTLVMSTGSNPMLGAPSNVATNIQPANQAVGWFLTTSVVSVETVFKDVFREL